MARSTRERVLDAAWELFQQHGFAGTTVTNIEAAASLSPGSGSFYRHFRSKEDVFRTAVEREVERAAASDVEGEVADHGRDVRAIVMGS